jgi:putative PIN family toxin of toxin-antitoxin system
LNRPRAVLDTNLLVRLLIWPRGLSGELLNALTERAYRLVTSEPLLEELAEVLSYPRLQRYGPFADQDIQRVLAVLRRLAIVAPGAYSDLEKVPADVKDNIVAACALEAGVDYIVTDDRRHLLPLKVIRCSGFDPVQVVRPGDFLRILKR